MGPSLMGDRKEVGKEKTDDSKLLSIVNSSLLCLSSSFSILLSVADARTSFSNCSSCPMKLKLGETTARRCLTASNASSRRSLCVFIRYAMQMVGEREMPASQCTSTFPPSCFTSSGKDRKSKSTLDMTFE